MRVLGIDCGTERTGFGIVDSDGRIHRLVDSGVIRTSPKAPFQDRLREIATELRARIVSFAPEMAAVEEVFYAVNVKTALKLSHVRGVALLVIAEAGVQFAEYSPLEVKTSVVGYGRAEKHQVKKMVTSLLKLEREIDSEDACDALAIAICHANHEATRKRMVAV
ncbi:MAG: crossover junction endodeoxyribonuclease RuvC [Bryobacterales bacterium]|nr:crossover junction endodeoxyribonuclease RuvC [Bryobacterales bacterium]